MKQNPNPKEKRPRPTRERDEAPADGIIEGRNAVIEALRAGTNIDKIFIMKGEVDTALGHIPPPPGAGASSSPTQTSANSTA